MAARKEFVIAVGFDGTLCAHSYPEIGFDIGAVPWMHRYSEIGARLILHTMRSDHDPPSRKGPPLPDGTRMEDQPNRLVLTEALDWCDEKGIKLWGVNENPGQKHWNGSRKVYAHLYVDDLALGVPMTSTADHPQPFVDWMIAGPMIERLALDRLGR